MALPVTRVEAAPLGAAAVRDGSWPASLPAVAQLLRDGLSLSAATVIVGENGTGKSTLIESIAEAYGLPPDGGTPRRGVTDHVTALAPALRIVRGRGATRHGLFLRSETPQQGYGTSNLRSDPEPGARAHELSHGESFLSSLASRRDQRGFYVLDEPESGLSFSSCLSLLAMLAELVQDGSQVLLATHSPILAALPGAGIVELTDDGLHETEWDQLDFVAHARKFLNDRDAYLRYLLE